MSTELDRLFQQAVAMVTALAHEDWDLFAEVADDALAIDALGALAATAALTASLVRGLSQAAGSDPTIILERLALNGGVLLSTS